MAERRSSNNRFTKKDNPRRNANQLKTGKELADQLPPPHSTRALQNPTPLREDPIYLDSIFGQDADVMEENMNTTFFPNCCGLMPIVNNVWQTYLIDNANLNKEMLAEGIRYYSAGLLWMRILQLKHSYKQDLLPRETMLLDIVSTTKLYVPKPIYTYMMALGAVRCKATQQLLTPEFPELPNVIVAGSAGLLGVADVDNHTIYEEFPLLGTCAEALRTALGDAPVGAYQTVIAPANTTANSNLQGFFPLVNRRTEAKNFFLNIGITQDHFPEDIENTAFNYPLMLAISDWIGKQRTFSNEIMTSDRVGDGGAQANLIITKPIQTIVVTRNSEGDVRSQSMIAESTTAFGMSYYCLFQLYKEPSIRPDNNASQNAATWSCITFTGANNAAIPQNWIDNRNERRNLPDEYQSVRFSAVSHKASNFRKRTIGRMKI